jgi:site-specific DNA-methyltransferase (adenine-specific)
VKPYYEEPGVTLYHGDALGVLPGLEIVRPVVITDPPYLNGDSGVWSSSPGGVAPARNRSKVVANPWGYSLAWVDEVARLRPSQWAVFANYRTLVSLLPAVERHASVSAVFTWRKRNAPRMARPVPRLDCEFIVWARAPGAGCGRMGEFDSLVLEVPMPQAGCMAGERILGPGTGKAFHPCQKPLAVVAPFVARLADPGDVVLDPFAGTGTTLRAAKDLGCRAVGVEICEAWCELTVKRLAQGVLPFAAAGEGG